MTDWYSSCRNKLLVELKPKPASVLIITRSEEAVACRCVSVILSVEGSGGQPTNRLKLQNDEDTDGRSNGLLTAAEQSKVAAVKPMLLLKRVLQASTATQQRQRISATIVKLENQAHKERSNVEHGTNIFFSFFFSSCP